jgi:DNA invertase Pin-like site-specific DNA recombinase
MRGKFIAYYRVSTDKQGESGLGLAAQRKAVADYLNGGNWELMGEFTEIESGKRNHRPELEKALATCKKHKARLVIAKLDRLSRSVAFIATMLERSKVDFVCVDNPHANKTMIHFIAVMAEFERDAIAERTRNALAIAKAKGKIIGNPDLGRKNKQDAAARAQQLRPIIAETAHLSMQAAAAELNRRGALTATGKPWHAMQILRVRQRLGM